MTELAIDVVTTGPWGISADAADVRADAKTEEFRSTATSDATQEGKT